MGRIAIIGGGISGLSLAYFLLEKDPHLDLVVLEAERRPGGKIWTEVTDGFLCEGGVNGFLDNRPKTLELSNRISLQPLRSNDASRKRFIFSDGRLHRLPESPPAFFSSDLMSLRGKLRIVAELFIPGNPTEEETLANFARRRLGRDAYEKLIDPMASGIYAGDPENLSLKACFPKIHDLEKRYGGLIKGMLRLQRERKKQGSSQKVGAGPGGTLTSFHDGMGVIVEAIRNYLGDRLRVGRKVDAIERRSSGYSLIFSDESKLDADIVISAAPAYAVSGMLKNMDKKLASLIAEIPYPSLSVVCLGYRKEKITHPVDAFGFLIPSKEGRKILGTLYDSSIFPNRAPEGYVLLRSMVGGARASDTARQSDSKLVDLVRSELAEIMGIQSAPDFAKVYKHEMAIPQYNVGHLERLRNIDGLVGRLPNLHLTGNAYRGIGVNDCIENSFLLAQKILEES